MGSHDAVPHGIVSVVQYPWDSAAEVRPALLKVRSALLELRPALLKGAAEGAPGAAGGALCWG